MQDMSSIHCAAQLTGTALYDGNRILQSCLTFCSMNEGALKVATSLDLFGHTSVLSNVERASPIVATRKPDRIAE